MIRAFFAALVLTTSLTGCFEGSPFEPGNRCYTNQCHPEICYTEPQPLYTEGCGPWPGERDG